MKYLLFISTIFFLFACTKGGGNIYLKGKVYNPVTGEGVSNVTIELVKSQPLKGDPFNGGDSKVVKSVTSDANGNIELSHAASLIHPYSYRYSLNGQLLKAIAWDSGVEPHGKSVEKGKNDYDNLKVVGFATYNIHVENINCSGETDTVRGGQTYLLTGENHKLFPHDFFRTGCYISNGQGSFKEGDYRLDWHVIRNGVRTDSSRVFQVRAGQENLIELLY